MKVYTTQRNCYVFDFDDTLVRTSALIYVMRDGKVTKALRSSDYVDYTLEEGEFYDFSEFRDPSFIWQGIELPMFKTLYNINKAIQENRSNSVVYILTARENVVLNAIYEYFLDRGITCLPKRHILTIGDDAQFHNMTTAEAKKVTLKTILDNGYDLTFFDDDIKNIKIANTIPGIKTRHLQDDDI